MGMHRSWTRHVWLNIVAAAILCLCVSANTELVNFDAVESPLAPSLLTANWIALCVAGPEKLLRIQPASLGTPLAEVCQRPSTTESCPHELWALLRLDDTAWNRYSRFTLRISWPASSPADFDVQVMSSEALLDQLAVADRDLDLDVRTLPPSRRMYARIRAVDTGVRTPLADGSHERTSPDLVPFNLVLEPLYFGALPASVAPTAIFIVLVALFAALVVVPPVQHYLCALAEEAKRDLAAGKLKVKAD